MRGALLLGAQSRALIPFPFPFERLPRRLQRVRFLGLFGRKMGIHFAHCGLESGMVFKGTTGVYESIYLFNSK